MAVRKTQETDKTKTDMIREAAEADLATFIRLIAPKNVMGSVHEELCAWWTREDASSHQIVMLPRDHGKSRYIGFRAAWHITKHPDCRILYVSATANLAEKQLKFIKDILTSDIHRRYWPEMIHPEEGKRERWTVTEISVDHPLRKEEGIRDPTVFACGVGASTTGMHFDVIIKDDLVVPENAYTEEGRNKVALASSFMASLAGADSKVWVVGTRYHPNDLYKSLLEMEEDVYDEEGEVIDKRPVYEKFEREVEDRGDGSGQFLWPIQIRADGKRFGFDRAVLARKRAQYLDRTQFYAQYYNNPNDPGNMRIDRSKFQYYDKKHITNSNGYWWYRDRKLNVFAAVDFAYSESTRSDYTAIVVIGIDRDGYIYVLDIDRFKTDRISEYFKHILDLHVKWDFRKLSAEVTAAQRAIVSQLKDHVRSYGLYLSIVDHKPTKQQGSKEERIAAVLEPRYDNDTIWHYKGGNCQVLEDELILAKPPHDDVKDALASAMDIAVPPVGMGQRDRTTSSNVIYHSRFGGISGRI